MNPLLQIDGLSKAFGGLQALKNVSFAVKRGQIKAVIGPNGAGKSTLFNLISGTLKPSSGSVTFMGRSLLGKKPYQIAELGMARTFQNIKMFSAMTALENVMVGRHIKSRSGFISSLLMSPWATREEGRIRDKSLALLGSLGLGEYAQVPAENLAFGQQRGVELARALALEPEILLLDEPAAGLNIYETAELARMISAIRDMGVTVLLVEHDMSLVMDISDEILVLSFGQKIAEDIPRAIQQNAEVIKIYLGG
ncbi:ABC transporter ATP-binding protein [Desulfotalea psychrophila]|uniref:Probable high-affinity branched-chain amino acid ABC transporter, ATP-binding protein n=1 Tax=Desulfotalea psychrophila (strain LSv54 / DSM 12343) TaxID=177439 RepID=Q6ANS5_DESPS|nr:ABC transporter ATP-binding protein [Desulfotalea psychrophila]CAG35999.1 probable high-affinity branched-chain amino acid ABC transporter, ATP-binding protein [Desulfotalea psychrophila LSv54]